jgi:DNA-binding CsgD family transcriptional regulator
MTPDHFISQLYRGATHISLTDFSNWALELLQQVIPFDGAIWGTGHISTKEFHTQASVDVDKTIFSRLKATLALNPIFTPLLAQQGKPIDMADIIDDQTFYRSDIYEQCFKPFGIERILSSMQLEQGSGIFTLLTLYRYDRNHLFSPQEKQTQQQLLFHLLSASSHRLLLALAEIDTKQKIKKSAVYSAICDTKGIYRAVDAGFLELLAMQGFTQAMPQLPFVLKADDDEYCLKNLSISQTRLGDLFRVSIRLQNQFDQLTGREKQVVSGVCQGKTFKEIAKNLHLSPSTVSNHLYRIYLKLGVNSRSELAKLNQTITKL